MKPPQSLEKHARGSGFKKLEDAAEGALVTVGTLKACMAEVIRMIPTPGGGMAVRRNKDGDKWSLTGTLPVWGIDPASGRIGPGLVGGIMPTLGGDALNATPPPTLTLTGSFLVWFQMNFTPSFTNGYLSGFTLNSVQIGSGASLPTSTNSTKYLLFNQVTNGRPGASFFSRSFGVALYDNGINSCGMFHGAA